MWIARVTTKSDDKIEKWEIRTEYTERLWDIINNVSEEITEIHIFKEIE